MAESELMPALPGYIRTSNGVRISWADVLNSVWDTDEFIVDDIQIREFRKGNAFSVGHIWEDVDSDTTKTLLLITGDNTIMCAYKVAGLALSDYGVYTSPTITSNGTALTSLHQNKLVSFIPTTTVYYDPAYSSIGTIEIPRFLGTSGNILSRSGGEKLEQVALLPADSSFIFAITNSSEAAQSRMGITIDWFETNWL
jgi:hypothetical protein